MSSSNNSLPVEAHLRARKTNSDNATGSENRSTTEERNDRSSGPVRSTSSAMAENVRDVRPVGNGYRRGVDLFAHNEPSGPDASIVSLDHGKNQQQESPASASGDGQKKGGMIQKTKAYENGRVTVSSNGGADVAEGIQKLQFGYRSPSTDSLENSCDDGRGSTEASRSWNLDNGNGNKNRRASVGEEQGVGTFTMNRSNAASNTSQTTTNGGHSVASSLAPYHVPHAMPGGTASSPTSMVMHQSASSQPIVRYQQQTSTAQRQTSQQSNFLTRPATFARLTRNGPFCPCFSPNDSDTEPSSPVAETAVSAAPSASGRNMATLARELRARFVANPASRTVANGTGQSSDRFASRGRGTAGEAINVVAEPYPVQVHTQVEYTHYLVPDLLEITRAPYYWGVMDRFEAERLLDNQPEGTFLLRDSAQSEYLFSVSFRRYNRTLHARIEQLNHKFSFDSYDQGVFSADTVTELIEHYKDPTKFLFFEPQLTLPLPRNFVFPLQHLCRSVIASRINYNDINQLELPKKFKDYLREYHYKHPVRVTKLE